jgi:phage shock protein C
MDKKFVRSKDRKIAGVCGGIAHYFGIDPLIIRVLFIALIFFGGAGFVMYFVLLLVMQDERDVNFTPYVEVDEKGDAKKVDDSDTNGMKEETIRKVTSGAANIGTFVFGLLLIFLGIFFFLRNFFPFFRFEYWFPLFLMLLGLILIFFGKKTKKE